ncbi:unnamed protein product [Blepharisma stoltei]|uniref:Uncharacterized protein n=1 Tax=Blepharisma stoltei TaxID=1481888 RepID=A0AAU9I9X3_9CILI|nr:unnamed protein product [Blepharisma stoltei]
MNSPSNPDYYRDERFWSDTLRSSKASKQPKSYRKYEEGANKSQNSSAISNEAKKRPPSVDSKPISSLLSHRIISPRLMKRLDLSSPRLYEENRGKMTSRTEASKQDTTQFLAEKLKEFENNYAILRDQYREIIERQAKEIEAIKKENSKLDSEISRYEEAMQTEKQKWEIERNEYEHIINTYKQNENSKLNNYYKKRLKDAEDMIEEQRKEFIAEIDKLYEENRRLKCSLKIKGKIDGIRENEKSE